MRKETFKHGTSLEEGKFILTNFPEDRLLKEGYVLTQSLFMRPPLTNYL
jgi:hypothetical protein